jgi:hypothetical protein
MTNTDFPCMEDAMGLICARHVSNVLDQGPPGEAEQKNSKVLASFLFGGEQLGRLVR